MKILAISGGSRNGTNDSVACAVLMGAKEQNAEIEFIHLHDLDLKPCNNCLSCTRGLFQGGRGECSIKDDFAWLDDKVKDADGVVFVMPVYEKGAPAVFKILQDRMFGPGHDAGMLYVSKKAAEKSGTEGPDPRLLKQKVMSFIATGGTDWNTRILADYYLAAMSTMWKVIDAAALPWSHAMVADDGEMKKCYDIGVRIAQAAADIEHAAFCGDPGVCPNCHSRNFFLHEDGTAECVVCGIQGTLTSAPGKGSAFTFGEEQWDLADNLMPGKMKHVEDMQNSIKKWSTLMSTPEFKSRKDAYRTFIEPSQPSKQ